MEKLNEYLQTLMSTCSYELHLEPNKTPYVVSQSGMTEVANSPLLGTQISMLIFPIIPAAVKQELPNKQEIEFVHNHNLGNFNFLVKKSPAGFNVTVRPMLSEQNYDVGSQMAEKFSSISEISQTPVSSFSNSIAEENFSLQETVKNNLPEIEIVSANDPEFTTVFSANSTYEPPIRNAEFAPMPQIAPEPPIVPQQEFVQQQPVQQISVPQSNFVPAKENLQIRNQMDKLFYKMAEAGASDLHMSVSMPPMIRKDGKMQILEDGQTLTPESVKELLTSIMPGKNQQEFEERRDSDFAYEIKDLARFRANIFMDRKGMGGVFRIIPSKILTAEQLGLSPAILNLCGLSKGLVVVTGPTGSGKSTTLCAMIDYINDNRDEHIITIEDPIEFTHENKKCLVNQREVHNHTDSFKDALRAALREDPDILLVGEMRDLETISIAIETAETGHLVFGTLHTTTAASTIDRIIDQFPPDRQQQIRVMLSESLKGVIAQTLLPKKGGGRVAALEILIVTPAISNLIREGKTFQIPSAMQTGKNHGMVMLNDALFELVKKGLVEPRDAYIKAVDKTNFETLLTRNGFKI
jgi:twitching motility protein PilT